MDPPNDTSLFCGEPVAFVCTANKTKYIKISIPNYGLHTFKRNSPKMTWLGPFTLNLTEAEGDSENLLLTSFKVRGFTSEGFIPTNVLVTCSDVYSSQTVNYHIQSKFSVSVVLLLHYFFWLKFCYYNHFYASCT